MFPDALLNSRNIAGKDQLDSQNTAKADKANPVLTGKITLSSTGTDWDGLTDPGDGRRSFIGTVATVGGGQAPNIISLKCSAMDSTLDIFHYNDGADACFGLAIRSGGVWKKLMDIRADTGRISLGAIQADSLFGENSMTVPAGGSGDNVLALRNLAPNHYSAVRFISSGGAEVGAVGFANPETIEVFKGANYWESFDGLYDIRFVMGANKGTAVCIEKVTGNFQIFADSGSQDIAKGVKVFQVDRATGNLTTAGDVEITDSAKGVIMKSPDGTRYRLSVANGGAISEVAV